MFLLLGRVAWLLGLKLRRVPDRLLQALEAGVFPRGVRPLGDGAESLKRLLGKLLHLRLLGARLQVDDESVELLVALFRLV